MKRCAACGNIRDDNSTVCEVCGKPYEDIEENTSEAAIVSEPQPEEAGQEESASQEEAAVEDTEETAEEQPRTREPQGAPRGQQPRRMRSGPQIYGQSGSVPQRVSYDQQGMVRRNMQSRSAATAARSSSGYPGAAAQSPAGYPGGTSQSPAGYPGGTSQSPAGYPGGASQSPAGYPGGASQSPAGYPGAAPRRRSVNDPGPGTQPRPAAGQMARQAGPGQNMAGRPMMQSPSQKARQVSATARKMLRSPVFLIIALLNTLYLGGSIASIFMGQLNYSQYARVIQAIELPNQVSGYVSSAVSLLSKLDSGMFAANLALRIPDLLFCIGLWLVFIMAATAEDGMSGIGFGFMKADIIINMVVSCAAMLLVLVAMVATVVASWVSENTLMIAVTVIALVATIIVVMMIIMYYFSYLASLTSCRVNADTGERYGKVSAYVAVLHIVLGLFAVVGLLSGIVNSEIAAIASAVGRLGWMILFGVWMLMYRGRLADIEE